MVSVYGNDDMRKTLAALTCEEVEIYSEIREIYSVGGWILGPGVKCLLSFAWGLDGGCQGSDQSLAVVFRKQMQCTPDNYGFLDETGYTFGKEQRLYCLGKRSVKRSYILKYYPCVKEVRGRQQARGLLEVFRGRRKAGICADTNVSYCKTQECGVRLASIQWVLMSWLGSEEWQRPREFLRGRVWFEALIL